MTEQLILKLKITVLLSFFVHRVKLTLFARESDSGNDVDAHKLIEMINSGEAKGLEENGFKVESVSTSKYLLLLKTSGPSCSNDRV